MPRDAPTCGLVKLRSSVVTDLRGQQAFAVADGAQLAFIPHLVRPVWRPRWSVPPFLRHAGRCPESLEIGCVNQYGPFLAMRGDQTGHDHRKYAPIVLPLTADAACLVSPACGDDLFAKHRAAWQRYTHGFIRRWHRSPTALGLLFAQSCHTDSTLRRMCWLLVWWSWMSVLYVTFG